ncbi:hypothetical protein [Bradyrhizobium sp. MOS003]|uniref:hypothetical protein n=1 Tax=Bradyrhizobium sp. MOS003 TaxID=2133946 RepID=UPI0011BE402C|nr:hypothetical protein [Bradyrhizobium sp. MOS003]
MTATRALTFTALAVIAAGSSALAGPLMSEKDCLELVKLTRECRTRANHYEKSQLASDAARFRQCEKLYFESYTNFCDSNREFIAMIRKGAEQKRALEGAVAPEIARPDANDETVSASTGGGFSTNEVVGIIGELAIIGLGAAAGTASSSGYSNGPRTQMPSVPRSRDSGVSGGSR